MTRPRLGPDNASSPRERTKDENMAYSDPLVLADNTPTNQNFTRKSFINGGSDWVEDDSTSASERVIVMRHTNGGPSKTKGSAPKQRHLTQFVFRKYNSIIAATDYFKVNLTIEDDPGSGVTIAEKNHILAFVRSFATSTNLDKILRGES
jgi:hypothetical protein